MQGTTEMREKPMETDSVSPVGVDVELVPLKVQPLDVDAFEPFGKVIRQGTAGYPDIDGDSCVVLLELEKNKTDLLWNVIAYHHDYNQIFIPLINPLVMCVTPIPTPAASGDGMTVDYEATRAFLVNVGEAVELKRGVGHNAIPATDQGCRFITVTRRLPEELERMLISKEVDNDIEEFDVPGNELINLPKQDGRAFLIEV
jgi:ureidoglycolate hydrolase